MLEVDSGGLAYWVAAIRECFEEAGLLLAYGPGGDDLVGMGEGEVAGRFARHRSGVDGGSLSLVELCAVEGLTLAVDRIHYFSHWITPEGAPRRYDTRFFVTAAPSDQEASHDNREAVADVWIRPADALERSRAGELALILPTLRNLVAISRFARSADLLAHAAAIGRVPAILPRLVADEHGTRIVLPGDPLYDQVGAGAGWPEGMPLPGLAGGPNLADPPAAEGPGT
jgi:8-oxo-dGTP pyrophosphatase MutT (NUDIX family)